MQRYIKFARTIKPKLTKAAQKVLVTEYRKLRQGDSVGRQACILSQYIVLGINKSSYRITVRQLESMIRLAEGRARLDCSDEVTGLLAYLNLNFGQVRTSDVREACRLLKKSILNVETEDLV